MLTAALMMLLQAAPVPTFSAQVQLVSFTMNATDAKTGKTVADLTPTDIQILEDGRRQVVQHFEREDVPASVIILMDTSASMRKLIPAVRDAAARLVRTLRPVDEVQIATFDTRYRRLCDFTTDHEAAVAALSGVVEGENTAMNWALYNAMRFLEKRFPEDIERRRIIIVLSDAEDTYSSMKYDDLLNAIRRSAVTCYVIHLQGNIIEAESQSRQKQARQFVRSLVEETGGRIAVVPYPHARYLIAQAFDDIAGDLGSQYHVAYASSADADRTGWRSVQVMMVSRIGVSLSYRRTYYVPVRQ